MVSPTAPGNSELMRAIEGLRNDVRDLSDRLDTGYVRKDVYAADKTGDALIRAGMEDEHRIINVRLDSLHTRIDAMRTERTKEREDQDKQRNSDRRLFYSVAFTALLGPLIVNIILNVVLKAH